MNTKPDDAAMLVAELLDALEEVQSDLMSGWTEPRSIALTLCNVRTAVLKGREFMKRHKSK